MLTRSDYHTIADAFDELTIRSRQARALSEVLAAAMPNLDSEEPAQEVLGLLNELLTVNDTAMESLQKRLLSMRPE